MKEEKDVKGKEEEKEEKEEEEENADAIKIRKYSQIREAHFDGDEKSFHMIIMCSLF